MQYKEDVLYYFIYAFNSCFDWTQYLLGDYDIWNKGFIYQKTSLLLELILSNLKLSNQFISNWWRNTKFQPQLLKSKFFISIALKLCNIDSNYAVSLLFSNKFIRKLYIIYKQRAEFCYSWLDLTMDQMWYGWGIGDWIWDFKVWLSRFEGFCCWWKFK